MCKDLCWQLIVYILRDRLVNSTVVWYLVVDSSFEDKSLKTFRYEQCTWARIEYVCWWDCCSIAVVDEL